MAKSYGLKKQISELNPKKMGFWRAKQGLSKHGILRPNWSHVLGKERNRGEKRGKEIRRGRRWRSQDQGQRGMELWIFGMETNLDYEFYEIWHVSLGLYDDYFAQT